MYGWHTLKTCWKKSLVSHWLVLYFALQTLKLAAMNLKLSLWQGNKCSWYKTCLHTEQALNTHKLEDFRLSHLFWIILQKQIHTVLISTWYMPYENCSTIFLSIACVKFLFLTKLDKGSTKTYTQDFQKTLEHLLFFSLFSFFLLFLCGGGDCV